MSKTRKIKWFLDQIPDLTGSKIISEESGKSLYSHYQGQIDQIKQKHRQNMFKPIIIILISLAVLSIIGGIILIVINYNWANVPKSVKTGLAFTFLLSAQGMCAYLVFIRKKINAALNEGFSLALALFFGICVAFIGQIYQLSSNYEAFLLIWAVSTLAVIYLFRSLSATIFYLVLIVLHTIVMQNGEKIGLGFYLFLIALVPFYIMEYKTNTLLRQKLLDYFLMVTVIVSLGITLEKAVPGLWIVAYANLFVLLYLFGIVFEKKAGGSILMEPFKTVGIIGVAAIGALILLQWPWDDIGWFSFREEARFDKIAMFFDFAICIIMPLLSGLLAWRAFRREKPVNYLVAGFGLLTMAAYIIVALTHSTEISAYLVTRILYFYVAALAVWGIHKGLRYQKRLLGSLSLIYLLVVGGMVFAWEESYENGAWLVTLFSAPALYYLLARIFEKSGKPTFFTFLKVVNLLILGGTLYALTWYPVWDTIKEMIDDRSINTGLRILEMLMVLVIPVVGGVIAYIAYLRNRKFNLLVPFWSLTIYILVLFTMLFRQLEIMPVIAVVVTHLYIFTLGIYSFYLGFKTRSIITIIACSIMLYTVLITRFFDQEMNVLVKGIGMMTIGVAFVLVSLFFISKIRKMREIDDGEGHNT